MKSRGKRISSIGLVLLILIISAVCMLPCLRSGLPYGDDQSVHMLRVECILKALKSGQGYPVYIYQNMLEGYGYGMGIFYPDLFLLPAVLFRALGASPEIAMKLYIYVLLVCTCITSYHAGKMIGDHDTLYHGTLSPGGYIYEICAGRSGSHGICSAGISLVVRSHREKS